MLRSMLIISSYISNFPAWGSMITDPSIEWCALCAQLTAQCTWLHTICPPPPFFNLCIHLWKKMAPISQPSSNICRKLGADQLQLIFQVRNPIVILPELSDLWWLVSMSYRWCSRTLLSTLVCFVHLFSVLGHMYHTSTFYSQITYHFA